MALSKAELKKIEAKCRRDQKERYKRERAEWLESLDPKDWLFDGYPIKSKLDLERWEGLDWSKAYMDMGPSPAGNPGPYWHVPLPLEETVHRLYPKVLKTKWLLTIRQALFEAKEGAQQDGS